MRRIEADWVHSTSVMDSTYTPLGRMMKVIAIVIQIGHSNKPISIHPFKS